MRIDLPNGQWAALRDPEEVPERLRRPIVRALRPVRPEIQERSQAAAELDEIPDPDRPGETIPGPEKRKALQRLQFDMTNPEADAYQDAGDLGIIALVAEWSFGDTVTLDGLLDLPGRTLDALRRKTAPHIGRLFVDATPDPNPAAPGGGSNGSATPSEEVPSTTSLTSSEPTSSSRSD